MVSRKLIVGNWKMHGTLEIARDRVAALVEKLEECGTHHQTVICPSFVHLSLVQSRLIGSNIFLGAQDCSPSQEGAYTGDISAAMLKDIGCAYVILGHSERRRYHEESSEAIKAKMVAVHEVGIKAIFCVGESLAEREQNKTLEVIEKEVKEALPSSTHANNTLIAYEPLWAIGTGKTPSTHEIQEVHAFLRKCLKTMGSSFQKIPLLYGGSVNSQNAPSFLALPDVDGLLVGGASLDPNEFLKLLSA